MADLESKILSITEAKQAFKEYFRILKENNDVPENPGYKRFPPTEADIDHSALLQRLLSGKKALTFPPPLSHAYPWYDLGEGKECHITELHLRDSTKLEKEESGRDYHLVIDQNPDWIKIDERTVQYGHNRYRLNMTFSEAFDIYNKSPYSQAYRPAYGYYFLAVACIEKGGPFLTIKKIDVPEKGIT